MSFEDFSKSTFSEVLLRSTFSVRKLRHNVHKVLACHLRYEFDIRDKRSALQGFSFTYILNGISFQLRNMISNFSLEITLKDHLFQLKDQFHQACSYFTNNYTL